VSAITNTIDFLKKSRDPVYSHYNVDEIIMTLMALQKQYEQTGRLDNASVISLFAPTGIIQEISIDNGWGDRFLELAQELDELTK
jgi:hypothetical protein